MAATATLSGNSKQSTLLSALAGRFRLAQFWRWWTTELRAAMPLFVLQAMARESNAADISCDSGSAVLLKANVNSVTELKRVTFKSEDGVTQRAGFQELLRGLGNEVRLVFDEKNVLVKQVMLPLATEENLREVLAFDMDRQTPFKASQVYFDCKVVKRDAVHNHLQAKLAVVTRAHAEQRLALLRNAGLTVTGIAVRDDLGGTAPYLDLLPAEQRTTPRLTRKQIINRLLMGIAGLLAVAAIALPIWQKREIAIALIPLLDKARQESRVTEKVMDEFGILSERYNFVMSKKQSTQPVTDLLDELSRLLPDNTWLQIFDIRSPANKPREMVVSGETASTSKLVEIFEHSTMLQNTNQRNGETRSTVPGMVRFQIGAEIKPRTYSEAVPPLMPAVVSAPVAAPVTGSVTAPNNPAPASPAPVPAPVKTLPATESSTARSASPASRSGPVPMFAPAPAPAPASPSPENSMPRPMFGPQPTGKP